jgi:hypothetical protein
MKPKALTQKNNEAAKSAIFRGLDSNTKTEIVFLTITQVKNVATTKGILIRKRLSVLFQ